MTTSAPRLFTQSTFAVLLAVGVGAGLYLNREQPVEFAASLTGTELAPDASGEVTLTKHPSGWDIRLHATGLPRREDGEFYQAWLKNEDGSPSPRSFNDGRDVILWAGVPPSAFATLTITQEVADGDQASSGLVVLIGVAAESEPRSRCAR